MPVDESEAEESVSVLADLDGQREAGDDEPNLVGKEVITCVRQ